MNLLDDIDVPKQPSRASLQKQATKLIGKRKTRRGKKKKKQKSAKWRKEYAEALREHKKMKEEMEKDFLRLIN